MESWVLEGDSYSFLCNAPCDFNLQNLDGPNRVEIFDITSIPSNRSAISETTCLCDIFGDDCESPSLSSSPTTASFLPKDVDEQVPAEDVDDSSDSYHTANGLEHLSDGSDTFEDSKETKDSPLSRSRESNTPASDLTLPNGSPKPRENLQESCLSQDTSLVQAENSSVQQLVASTSEFRDTNIRVTGSAQNIISPNLLLENKGIRDQTYATSSEPWEPDLTEIATPDLRCITKQRDASLSERQENDSTEWMIIPDSLSEIRGKTEQRVTTGSEVRETASEVTETFSENEASAEFFNNLGSKENNDLGSSVEEEKKISLPDILPTENILHVHKRVKSGSSDAWTNLSNDCSDFIPVQETVSDPSTKNEAYDLTEMSAPLEYTGRLQSAHPGTFLCNDKPGLSDLEDPSTVPPPFNVEDNAETDRASVSDTSERLSESCSPSGPLVDVHSSEPSIIIHSPVGFSLCSSPEPKNKIWSTEPEDVAFTPENLESDCRLTPTDKSSVSSFDSKPCPTPEPGSITYSPENRQNAFRYELGPAASSPELRSASCSPEIEIMACRSLTQPSESLQIQNKAPQNDLSSQREVLAQTHDIEGIVPTESFMSAEEVADMTDISTLCNPLSTQGGILSPSTTLPRDNMSPDLIGTRYPESPTSNMLPTNDTTNMAISSNLSSMDRCIISSHSPIGIQRRTESPDIHNIRSVESSISNIPPTNETTTMDGSPVCHLSSTEGSISRSASTLSIPRDTASPDMMGTRCTESSMATTRPTNVVSPPILQSSSTEEGIFRPPSNLGSPRDTATPDVDCVRSPASTTVLTNDITIMALSSFSSHSPTGSNLNIQGDTLSPDVEGTRKAQDSMSTMLPIKETEDVVISPSTHLSSTEGGIPRSPSPSSILIDTMCPDKPGTGCVECSLSTRPNTNETRNMANSPISNPSSTDTGIPRPSSTLSRPSGIAQTDMDGIECVAIPTANTALINEITNMANSPINLSLTGPISRPPSNLSTSIDIMCLDVQETKHTEESNEIPMNENTNMAVSPISNLSSTEEGLSRPPLISSIPRTTVFNDLDGLRCVESQPHQPTSTILPKNEAQNMGMSPILNVSPTDRGLSYPLSAFSIPRDTISPDVEGTRYTKRSNVVPTNETIDMAVSNISTKDGGISRPPSTSSIPRTTVSTDVDGLRCVESPTTTIFPTNEAPNMSLSNPQSVFSLPRDSIYPDVQGTRCTKRSNEIPINEITNMDNIFTSKLSSTEEGISSPSTTLSITRDTMFPDVGGIKCVKNSTSPILPTSIEMAPVYILASTDEDSTQPLNLGIPRDTMYPARSNEVPTVPSPKMRYQRSPDRFKEDILLQEMCIPQGYTDNHLSTTITEKVDLPLMVPLVRDDTGYKMSLKSLSLPQDDCKEIALVPCNQGDKVISDLSPEKPAPKLSVKQIKENWEKMNENILNSLNPWQTSKKSSVVPTAKGAKEGNISGREMFERESAGSEKTFGQMAMRPGESPNVLHSNNHSMYKGQSCRNKGWNGGRVIQEEHTLGKGVGNIAEGSYRGEQVELSFSTRNRKGPANHSPAPSSRDPKSGIPPRYFESPLATRRQQSLLRAQNLQKENKTGARRVRSTSQSNRSGRLSSECASETSSMGSEIDDADTEVKWFTDQAFRSLSSPQVDYLDVYNSSCGSSTNVSQPSTLDSPGSATWVSYADLHDSLPENGNVSCHTSSFLPHGTLDPAKRFEMGSFECVDVAVESKEQTRRGKRTVPKRQIQFKRRNFDELKSESEENPMDLLSTPTCSRDTLVRQHSTPASMQEDLGHGEHEMQTGKKMLQKSASLDESSRKSKMASGVIKSVLSKKMDTASKEPSRSEPCENKKKDIETLSAAEASNAERQSFSLPYECSLSSDDFASKEERSPHPQRRSCRPKVPPKPVFKPNCLPFNNNPVGLAFQDKPPVKDQVRPIMVDAFESRISNKQPIGNPEREASKMSGSAINQTPNCTAICVASMGRKTNSDNKHPMTPETHKQQESSSSLFLSKTPEITLKPCAIKDKTKSSTKASNCSELEVSKDTIHEPQVEETLEEPMTFKPGLEADDEEDEEKNKVKSVIHKVRDVRKLVKNTYNLTFKASNATNNVDEVVPEKQKETQPENPHPLHIECKAISWKEKTASCNKSTTQKDVAQICTADKSEMPQTDSHVTKDEGFTKITSIPNVQHIQQNTKQEMPPRPSSKEISTLVFLQDATPKSVQTPTCPPSPNVKTANSIHSVSMLRKEKGMQADIGVCDILNEKAGAKPKHINRLEVPLQKGDAYLPPDHKTSLNSGLQKSEGTLEVRNSPRPKEMRVIPNGKGEDNQSQGDLVQSPKEQEITVAASSKARAFSSNAKIHATPVTTSKEIELPIQVRSISSDRPKPTVLPKPSYKQPFAEIRSTSSDFPKTDITPTTSILKEQTHLKSDVKIIESSTTVIQNEQSTNTTSSNTKTLAVSSQKPQTIPVTTMSSTVQKSTATTNRQEVSITSVQNSSNQQQQNIQEQVTPATSYASNYQTLPVVSQANTYMQPTTTTSSNNHLHTDFHFPTSDDPPSYDERESFSPLQLSDLPPRRQNRYHPTTKHSLCSCTSCTQPQFGQPYHGPQNQTPPATRSPGQVISYPGAPPQAQVRPHQCRPDGQPLNYPSISPKTTIQQAPAMIQPMHHSHTCPAPAIQPYGNEQQQPSAQNVDRRPGNQRSPQTPSGAYREHSRSPNIAALDPRSQFFNPQELPPTFGHEYGSDAPGGGGVLYPENASGLGYGQGPRRVLLDPETGKYFYIEVPMQPLRKMLFDPEIGQYVEVLIPQQAMSNSTMYPPTAAPYQGPYHGQGLYASQYLPYAMPPHSQSAQQPRHPEPTVPTSLHQNTMGYGSSASQVPKSDVKGHPSLDQSYLESMYYIPTGMNASPNSTPSDCYHKPATNMPAAGGRRA